MPPAARESHSMSKPDWVLVTGGALRLGREIGLAFAQAGWNVLCHYRTSEAEALTTQAAIRDLGRDCLLVRMDLAQPDATSHLLNQCLTLTGSAPRCIVNNASIFEADDACTANTRGLLDHFQTNTVTPLLLGNALLTRQWTLQRDPCARPKSTQHQPRLFFVHRQQIGSRTQHRPAGPSLGAFGAGMRALTWSGLS